MYACENCGGLFAIPDTYTECLTTDPPTYEKRSMSPCCGDDYHKAFECPVCNDFTRSDRSGGLCDVCAKNAADGLKEFLNCMEAAEIRWLDFLLDGVSLEEFRDGR